MLNAANARQNFLNSLGVFNLSLIFLLLLEVGLSFFLGGSVLTNSQLPVTFRLAAFVPEYLGLVCFTLILVMFQRCFELSKTLSCSFFRKGLVTVVSVLCFSSFSFLCFSWGLLQLGGHFLGYVGLSMLRYDTVQIFQHAIEFNVLALMSTLLGALFCTCLVLWVFPRVAENVSSLTWRIMTLLVILLTIVVALGFNYALAQSYGVKSGIYEEKTGIEYRFDEYFKIAFREHAGPLAYLYFDLKQFFQLMNKPHYASHGIMVQQNPLLPMEDYLATINREQHKPYNVLVILIESLRKDQLGIYQGRNAMPVVNAMAEEAWVFTNAYSQSSHSNYADLAPLNSRYPLYTRTMYRYPEHLPYPRVMIYDILKKLGYRTAIISSQNEMWGGMHHYLNSPGLDTFIHAENYFEDTAASIETDEPVSYSEAENTKSWSIGNFMLRGAKHSGKIDDSLTVSEIIRWLNLSDNNKPFFIYTNLQNSHAPYNIPEGFPRKFSRAEDDEAFAWENKPSHLGKLKDRYSDSLGYMDAQLKRLFDYLKEQKLWDNTIIVLGADTATAFGEHKTLGNAGKLFNEVVNVPLMIKVPGRPAQISHQLMEHVDVPPTLLHLLGLPSHPSFQGIDLLAEKTVDKAVFMVSQAFYHQYAVVYDNWKLIYDEGRDRVALYNLADDPGELVDLSKQQPEKAAFLSDLLLAWTSQQIAYYQSPLRQKQEYPPRYRPKQHNIMINK